MYCNIYDLSAGALANYAKGVKLGKLSGWVDISFPEYYTCPSLWKAWVSVYSSA
jgi:hypothetical protein